MRRIVFSTENGVTRDFARVVVALVPLVWLMPLLLTGSWYDSHEYYRYPWLAQEFAAAFKSGILYPRWLPNINGSYGYPTFVFYQPGFFYLATLFTYLFNDVIHACYAAVYVILLVGMSGAYKLARLWAGRAESLVFALIYLATPYLLFNYLTRGDLTELMAMVLAPWQIFYLWRTARGAHPERAALKLGLLVAAQCYSHLFVAGPMVGVLAVLALVLWWEKKEAQLARLYIASLLGGLILASPHWWTIIQLKNDVEYAAALGDIYVTTGNLESAAELAVRFWRVPFFVSLIGFWLARGDRFMTAAFGVMLALVLMTHTVSQPVWAHVHLLDYFQFPWRFYSVVAALQLLGLIQLVRLRRRLKRQFFEEGMVLVLLFTVLVEMGGLQWPAGLDFSKVRSYLPWQYETLNNKREFDPRTMHNLNAIPDRRRQPTPVVMLSEAFPGVQLDTSFDGLPYRINFGVKMPPQTRFDGPLPDFIINQMYFPGWKVTVNGHPIRLAGPGTPPQEPVMQYDANGRLVVKLPGEGKYDVWAWYDGPPGWALRNALIVLSLAGLVAWVRRPGYVKRLLQSLRKGIFQDAS